MNINFTSFQDKDLSYRDLINGVKKTSSYFEKIGLTHKDIIVISSADDSILITTLFTALLNGITFVVFPTDIKARRAQPILNELNPNHIFIDHDIHCEWDWFKKYQHTDIKSDGFNGILKRIFNNKNTPAHFPAITQQLPPREPSLQGESNSIAFIAYSSGTTSAPKGIMLTYQNLFEHLLTLKNSFQYSSDSKIFNNLSLAHNDGLVQGPILSAYLGASLYRPEGFTVQNIEMLLNTIYRENISHFIAVPTIISLIDRLTTHNDYFESPSFKYFISVAAKLDNNLTTRIKNRFGITLSNIYGLTETVAGGIFSIAGTASYCFGTVGKPIDIEAKIVNEADQPSEVGELLLKGNNIMQGYYKNPEASANVIRDGWLYTGDLASYSSDGFIQIVGRKKSVIMSGGYNIHSDEIDEALMAHPNVIASCTIGVEDVEWGEIVTSVIELSMDTDENELFLHCRNLLETYKVPKQIIVTDALPRGVSGKVSIPDLKAMVADIDTASPHVHQDLSESGIINMAASVFNLEPSELSLTTDYASLKEWDSLGHLDLIGYAENCFSIKLGIQDVLNINNLEDLLNVCLEKYSYEIN